MFNKKLQERIEKLEGTVGEFKKKERTEGQLSYFNIVNSWLDGWTTPPENTLVQKHEVLQKKHEQLKENFLELDHKFDLLERYLQIEYFKIDENTATYDWADKTSNEGFRKAKPYEAVKAEKNKPNCSPCDCDD
jgi:hypothetical protein